MKKLTPVFLLLFFIFTQNLNLYSQSGDICEDIKQVQAAAGNNFESIKGSLRSESGETFKTTTHNTTKCIYRAKDCYIQNTLGASYYAIMSEHDTYEDAEKAYDFQLMILELCMFNDRKIVTLNPDGNTLKSTAFLPTHLFGYNLDGDYFDIYKNDAGKYVVRININTVEISNKIYNSYGGSLFNILGVNFFKIMNSAPNNFKEVLGEKQEVKGFMGTTYKYTANIKLNDISELSYTEGGLSFSNDLKGLFYEGSDKAEATKMFNQLSEKISNTINSLFGETYVYKKSESDDGEFMQHVFVKESELFNEKASLATAELSYNKYDKKYSVYLKFSYKNIDGLF